MNLAQVSPQVNTVDIVSARSNGREYNLTLDSLAGHIELSVPEFIYRRALIDILSPEDIEELNQWLDERHAEVIEMHEEEFGQWPQLPPDNALEDMANHHAGIARNNGYVLGGSATNQNNALAKAAGVAGYETVDEYLSDTAWELNYKLQIEGVHVDYETARQWIVDSEGDVDNALSMVLEDRDYSDPRQEAHFSPSFLNS